MASDRVGDISRATSSRMIGFSVSDDRLTEPQAHHVEEIGKEFCHAMADKYAKGQAEHGGNLWDLSLGKLVDCAIEEAIDQVVYLMTIRQKLREAVLDAARNPSDSLRR